MAATGIMNVMNFLDMPISASISGRRNRCAIATRAPNYEVGEIYSFYIASTELTLVVECGKGLRSGEWGLASGPSGGCMVGASLRWLGGQAGKRQSLV